VPMGGGNPKSASKRTCEETGDVRISDPCGTGAIDHVDFAEVPPSTSRAAR